MTFAIDCFAGAGGFSLGAERAGLQVVAAINHWRCAVDTHAANLPHAVHRLEDACLLDWRDLPTFSVLLASPACQGHSRSRGQDRPHHDVSRSSAWAVIRAAEVCRPRAILVENVPEFTSWLLYDLWCAALQKLGYTLTSTLIDAADLGVPQTRVRLLLAATLGPPPHLALNPADRRPPQPADDTIAWEDGTWGPPARLVPRTPGPDRGVSAARLAPRPGTVQRIGPLRAPRLRALGHADHHRSLGPAPRGRPVPHAHPPGVPPRPGLSGQLPARRHPARRREAARQRRPARAGGLGLYAAVGGAVIGAIRTRSRCR